MSEHKPDIDECCDDNLFIVNHKFMISYHSHVQGNIPLLYMMMLDTNENRFVTAVLEVDQVKILIDKLTNYYLPRMQRRLNSANLANMKVGASN